MHLPTYIHHHIETLWNMQGSSIRPLPYTLPVADIVICSSIKPAGYRRWALCVTVQGNCCPTICHHFAIIVNYTGHGNSDIPASSSCQSLNYRDRFIDSIFELVDIWTETVEEQEYLDLLDLITTGITKVQTRCCGRDSSM